MNTVVNIKKVSLLLFILVAGAHILSTLLLARGYTDRSLYLINGTFDLPAILVGILYAFSSAKSTMENLGKDTKTFDLMAGIFGGLILVGALLVNFLF